MKQKFMIGLAMIIVALVLYIVATAVFLDVVALGLGFTGSLLVCFALSSFLRSRYLHKKPQ